MELIIEVPDCIKDSVINRLSFLTDNGYYFNHLLKTLESKDQADLYDQVNLARKVLVSRVRKALLRYPFEVRIEYNNDLDLVYLINIYWKILNQLGFDETLGGSISVGVDYNLALYLVEWLEGVSKRIKDHIDEKINGQNSYFYAAERAAGKSNR